MFRSLPSPLTSRLLAIVWHKHKHKCLSFLGPPHRTSRKKLKEMLGRKPRVIPHGVPEQALPVRGDAVELFHRIVWMIELLARRASASLSPPVFIGVSSSRVGQGGSNRCGCLSHEFGCQGSSPLENLSLCSTFPSAWMDDNGQDQERHGTALSYFTPNHS